MNSNEERTRYDEIILWLKNNQIIVILALAFLCYKFFTEFIDNTNKNIKNVEEISKYFKESEKEYQPSGTDINRDTVTSKKIENEVKVCSFDKFIQQDDNVVGVLLIDQSSGDTLLEQGSRLISKYLSTQTHSNNEINNIEIVNYKDLYPSDFDKVIVGIVSMTFVESQVKTQVDLIALKVFFSFRAIKDNEKVYYICSDEFHIAGVSFEDAKNNAYDKIFDYF